MRRFENSIQDVEFPDRYARDEARFAGGRERTFNKEDNTDEPTDHLS